MPNCSSRSCIVAPGLQHLQKPRSTATTVTSESSTVVTPEAPAASAAHDRQPPRERGPSGSATFTQQRHSKTTVCTKSIDLDLNIELRCR